MKRKILALVLITLLVLSLCSCELIKKFSEPRDGISLWKCIDEKMGSLDSFTSNTTASISVTVDGVVVDGTVTGDSVVVGMKSGELSLYQFSSTEIKIAATKTNQTSSSIVAYDNGNMYLFNKVDNNSKKLYSELSKEDFTTYFFEENSNFNISPEGCETVNFDKKDDGTWSLEYYGFSESDANEIACLMGFDPTTFGVVVDDVKVSATANAEYLMTEINIKLIADEKTVFDSKITYSDFDSAVKKEFDKDSYIRVDDVRVVNDISSKMNDELNRESGDFILKISHKLASKTGRISNSYLETDTVSYGMKDGKYTYDISAVASGQSIKMNYADGKQEVYVGNRLSATNDQTDMEARTVVSTLMNNAGYSPIYVTDVKKQDNGSFAVYCRTTDTSAYREIMSSCADTYQDYTLCFFATFDDNGDLKRLNCELVIIGSKYDYTVETMLDIIKE